MTNLTATQFGPAALYEGLGQALPFGLPKPLSQELNASQQFFRLYSGKYKEQPMI